LTGHVRSLLESGDSLDKENHGTPQRGIP
jgi:hypothetical protein